MEGIQVSDALATARIQEEAHRLYMIFFTAANGHPSILDRDFEKYIDRVSAILSLNDDLHQLLKDWDEYEHYGKKFEVGEDFYWKSDHMNLVIGDIKMIKEQAESRIADWHRDGDMEWDFLDLVRRTLHGIELTCENYEEIREYIEGAKAKAGEEAALLEQTVKKWQGYQDQIDAYFIGNDNYPGIEDCPLVKGLVIHRQDPVNVVLDVEFTFAPTGERAWLRIAQKEQGSPHFVVQGAYEIKPEPEKKKTGRGSKK